MNNTSIINQSKYKNSKVSFDVSQIHGQTVNYSEKDSMQNISGLGTKFSYTDPKSQSYLSKCKKKAEIDKADFHASRFALPIVQTEVTSVIENVLKGDKEVISSNKNLNATYYASSLRKQEKQQNYERYQQKLEKSRIQYVQEAQESLSMHKIEEVSILPTNQYTEQMINYMNQARENMNNAEFKHNSLLDENISLKKQINLLKEGVDLQNIRFKYYIQSAYNSLRSDSVFMLDQRLFQILVKSFLTDLEPQRSNFNQKILANFEAISAKVGHHSKQLQNLISDNETVLKFLDHDLHLEYFSTHLPAETLEQIQNQESGQQEAAIKALHTVISEKILEIEKYRIADNNSRQMINTLIAKSEEYERHIQRMMTGGENEAFKNNLKRVLEMKKENEIIVSENESLKKQIENIEQSRSQLIDENNLIQEKLIVYGKKLVQMLLDTNMSDQAVQNQMDELLQQENIDFYLKKRNMEFIKEKYSEHNDTKKLNAQQEQDIDNLQQQLELANQTIDQLEKKLIDQTMGKKTNAVQIPTLINIDDTSQLQHTIQQLSLILLSKDNAVQVDQTTLKIIKQLFSENFDQVNNINFKNQLTEFIFTKQMVEFQQETIDNLKMKLNEQEQRLYQSETKKNEYLNMSFYLSNLLIEIIDSQKDSNIRGRLQKERSQIMTFYGKSVQDFQDLIKQQNPRNILPVNQWYVNKLKEKKNGEEDKQQRGGEEQLKSSDDNILSDLTVLQSMGVKALQEYINMRINRVQEENDKLKEKMKNIKQENVTVAELKKQRLLDEERYVRLSRRLQAFCQDNIFTASENNDLIGHFNEDFMHSIFIQANTIEQMIDKTLENDEEDVNSRPSLSKDGNQSQKYDDNQRDSDVRNNQPPVLNHSIIEEKPGEEDEYVENGKRGVKVRKSFRNLSNSHHSQHDSTHEREGSGQGFDQKIQINISISSPDKSHSSSFSGQLQQPIVESQVQRVPYYEESQYYQKKPQQSLIASKQYEEDINYNKQYTTNSSGYQGYDTDSLASKSSAYQSSTTQLNEDQRKQLPQNQYQQQPIKQAAVVQTQQQQQQQPQYQQKQQQELQNTNKLPFQQQLSSQTPSFKNTPKSTNNNSLQNAQQVNQSSQQIYQNNKQLVDDAEEFEPRQAKPSQYIQQENKINYPKEERQKSNHSSNKNSLHHGQEQNERTNQFSNEQELDQEFQRQQQLQRQKEIQDLKRFSAQSTIQQFVDPTFKKRASDSQVGNINPNPNQTNQNFLQPQQQSNQNYQQTQINSSEHRNQLSISRNSQDRQKLFQETIGQISDIKPSSKKAIDDDNKASFNEDHFEILFGQRNNESIDNPYDNHSVEENEERDYQNRNSQQFQQQHNNYNKQNKNNYPHHNEEEEEYVGYRKSEFNIYEPQYDDEEHQDQSHQYQEDEDDEEEEHDDSLEQEAPYLHQE